MSRCGTPSGYTSGGCRCPACRHAHAAYITEERRMKRAGLTRLVPADSVRTHLLALSKRGVGRVSVAKAAGVSLRTIQFIRTGAQVKVRADIEAQILAVGPNDKTLYIRDRAAWWQHHLVRTSSFHPPLTGIAERLYA